MIKIGTHVLDVYYEGITCFVYAEITKGEYIKLNAGTAYDWGLDSELVYKVVNIKSWEGNNTGRLIVDAHIVREELKNANV